MRKIANFPKLWHVLPWLLTLATLVVMAVGGITFIGGTPFIEGSTCDACGGDGDCPQCNGTGMMGPSICHVCYDEPGVGRANHKCNTCKGTGLQPATELSSDW